MSDQIPVTFSEQDCRAIYSVIRSRRDVRSEFTSDAIPDDVLGRILDAAHHAPSVGFMQPWDFLLIESVSVRRRIYAHFQEMKQRADMYEAGRANLYKALKLEGILDAPLNVCVTCDRERTKGHGLGRQSDPMTDLYSTVCAVQNLWLAARAESVGVGWVSIIDLDTVKQMLGIPDHVHVVAYLCVGYVSRFRNRPELEDAGWEHRTPLQKLIRFDHWDNRDEDRAARFFVDADVPR
ncbi:MAG: 5,6-dimethylbenzimidazole synthase [Acidobacteriaceae bacterium]|nr:5,6-dimethylbenzimidazole synthase [Acidobacteriaceae bacterium]MBV8572490.1 5,6-dimethylbenzimidazole synthase [Acidobacteriaceae bacterium]